MTMEIRQFNQNDLVDIYPLMEEDFPADELKPLGMMLKFMDTGFMEGYGFYDEDRLMAYGLFLCKDDVRLFDYLAVVKEARGTGIGSLFLAKLKEVYADKECVIGEVENPDYCEDEETREMMERRIRFYLSNGFLDTGASGCVYHVEYRFFEMGVGRQHTAEEGLDRINLFYHTYWPNQEDYNRYVQMHEVKR